MKLTAIILIVCAVAICVCSAAEQPQRRLRGPQRVQRLRAVPAATAARRPQQLQQHRQQLRQQPLRRPVRPSTFARQEVAADLPVPVTPYPSADELKPEVPFVEEASAAQPDATYGPPDETYGPPEIDPSFEQLPSDEAPQQFAPNPEAEDFAADEQPAIEEDDEQLAQDEQQDQQSATVSQRFTQRRVKPVPAKLLKKKSAKRSKVAALRQQQRVVVKSSRLVAAPQPAAAFPVASEALVQTPLAIGVPLQQQRYVVVNHPFAYSAQAYQAW